MEKSLEKTCGTRVAWIDSLFGTRGAALSGVTSGVLAHRSGDGWQAPSQASPGEEMLMLTCLS